MNRWRNLLLIVTGLVILAGCVSPPDPRPPVTIQGERQLQLGVRAFNANDYRTAATLFNKAKELYQGIDDREGVIRCHINLTETALAVGNFLSAGRHLRELDTLQHEPELAAYRERIEMLRVKLDFAQARYPDALARLSPLLPEFNLKGEPSEALDLSALNAIASRTRLAFKESTEAASLWSGRYAAALNSIGGDLPYNRGLLKSFQAELARRNQDYDTAWSLLKGALAEYKLAGFRRGIALTLKSLANLQMEREQWPDAENYLQRALKVSTWMLDRSTTVGVLGDLAEVNEKLGNSELAGQYRHWHEKSGQGGFSDWQGLRAGTLEQVR